MSDISDYSGLTKAIDLVKKVNNKWHCIIPSCTKVFNTGNDCYRHIYWHFNLEFKKCDCDGECGCDDWNLFD